MPDEVLFLPNAQRIVEKRPVVSSLRQEPTQAEVLMSRLSQPFSSKMNSKPMSRSIHKKTHFYSH